MAARRTHFGVVDDDAQVGRAVARLLKTAGFQADLYGSGESLLETAPLQETDCLILDIDLPGMSGLELAERLRDAGSHTPLVFVTAQDDPVARERARKVGALGFVVKPFESEPLLALLSRAVSCT